MKDTPQIEGIPDPRKPHGAKSEDVDPDKFKKILKVGETDDTEKREKRNRPQREEEEAATSEAGEEQGVGAEAAPGFDELMGEDLNEGNMFDVGEGTSQTFETSGKGDDEDLSPMKMMSERKSSKIDKTKKSKKKEAQKDVKAKKEKVKTTTKAEGKKKIAPKKEAAKVEKKKEVDSEPSLDKSKHAEKKPKEEVKIPKEQIKPSITEYDREAIEAAKLAAKGKVEEKKLGVVAPSRGREEVSGVSSLKTAPKGADEDQQLGGEPDKRKEDKG